MPGSNCFTSISHLICLCSQVCKTLALALCQKACNCKANLREHLASHSLSPRETFFCCALPVPGPSEGVHPSCLHRSSWVLSVCRQLPGAICWQSSTRRCGRGWSSCRPSAGATWCASKSRPRGGLWWSSRRMPGAWLLDGTSGSRKPM